MTRTHEVEFVLLRHGQTQWNRQGIIQGQEDAKLDGDGVRQAEALGTALAGGRFGSIDVVASSDLSRASDTAYRVANALNISTSTVSLHKELRERHVGVLQGVSRRDVDKTHQQLWRTFRKGSDDDWKGHGGESYNDHWDRAVAWMERTARSHAHGTRIAVVTHGGTLHVLKDRCDVDDPLNRNNHKRGVVHNCSVGVVRITVSNTGCEWRCIKWGDTSHLDEANVGSLPHGHGGDAGGA
jgi:2,3-bisphosphoglycerate-dependent phosphoglycerate mutase